MNSTRPRFHNQSEPWFSRNGGFLITMDMGRACSKGFSLVYVYCDIMRLYCFGAWVHVVVSLGGRGGGAKFLVCDVWYWALAAA